MSTVINLVVLPHEASDHKAIVRAGQKLSPLIQATDQIVVLKKSVDARQRAIKINLRVEFFHSDETIPARYIPKTYSSTAESKSSVVIVGAGPAGLFAALELIQHGIKPIVLERGVDVQKRRRDLAKLNKEQIVNPESNYCFGEGGAGTYSDGKLYTRSTKRGDVMSILETLTQFGASENILTESHPHIGTNKLPKIIAAMREQIITSGGEVLFEHKVTDFHFENNVIKSVVCANNKTISADAVILATGHSARDVFQILADAQIEIEFKPFALGVRAEHPQKVIDSIQYHCDERGDHLPPASYSLVQQVENKGVYSFCMCPGGIIAPCATSPGEIVTNGWSPSKRNNPWANSGIVVTIEWDDIPEFHKFGPLAGVEFQKHIERLCWEAGGKSQVAPAQRINDFINGKKSSSLPSCSYFPGIKSVDFNEILPKFIRESLREGFIAFGKKMKGYLHPDAVIVGPESRTSSPVRIPRNAESLTHLRIENLYPCGEGAGYAGGIVSAAIDGEKVARKIAEKINSL